MDRGLPANTFTFIRRPSATVHEAPFLRHFVLDIEPEETKSRDNRECQEECQIVHLVFLASVLRYCERDDSDRGQIDSLATNQQWNVPS